MASGAHVTIVHFRLCFSISLSLSLSLSLFLTHTHTHSPSAQYYCIPSASALDKILVCERTWSLAFFAVSVQRFIRNSRTGENYARRIQSFVHACVPVAPATVYVCVHMPIDSFHIARCRWKPVRIWPP